MSCRNIDVQSVRPGPRAFGVEYGAVRMNGFTQSGVQLRSEHRLQAYVPS